MCEIKEYTLNDIPSIAEKKCALTRIHTLLDPDYYAPDKNADEDFRHYLEMKIGDVDFKVFLAKSNNDCIGYVMGWIKYRPVIYRKRRVGYLSNIHVDESYRKSGIKQYYRK